jgi:hypothetical protein
MASAAKPSSGRDRADDVGRGNVRTMTVNFTRAIVDTADSVKRSTQEKAVQRQLVSTIRLDISHSESRVARQ